MVTAALKVLVLLLLPFATLLWGAMLAWRDGFPVWLAVSLGAAFAGAVLTGYASWLSNKTTGRARVRVLATRVIAPLVIVYCAGALLHLAHGRAKSDAVRQEYRALHPLLRVAVSTVMLVDRGALITDLERAPEDYAAMGLRAQRWSHHYPQEDGYVHAMDIRTLGRSWVRNTLLTMYFRLTGFRTLRHVGTADHLHVSLPNRAPSH